MNLPSRYQIEAGLAACQALGADGTDRATLTLSLRKLPTGGRFRTDDMLRGVEVLVQAGLLCDTEGRLRLVDPELRKTTGGIEDVRIIAAAWLAANPPLWLRTAVTPQGAADELIPDEASNVLDDLGMTPEQRESLLLSLANTVDSSTNKELGDAGEAFVISSCKEQLANAGRIDLAAQVRHVSPLSDQLGYDVTCPDLDEQPQRLEVKTAGRAGAKFRFFLSRNEATVAASDPNWAMVGCAKTADGFALQGWCRFSTIEPLLPTDPEPLSTGSGRWSTVQVAIDRNTLHSGLPLGADAVMEVAGA